MHSSNFRDLARFADERGCVVSAFCELKETEGGMWNYVVILQNPDYDDKAYVVVGAYWSPTTGNWKWAVSETLRMSQQEAYAEYGARIIRAMPDLRRGSSEQRMRLYPPGA
jgi:hypothetical protein